MKDQNKAKVSPEELKKIENQINSVDFGTVTVTIQNGVIVQIETSQKIKVR